MLEFSVLAVDSTFESLLATLAVMVMRRSLEVLVVEAVLTTSERVVGRVLVGERRACVVSPGLEQHWAPDPSDLGLRTRLTDSRPDGSETARGLDAR